jgi:uncharacterized protein YndB with AHSA1/START domain
MSIDRHASDRARTLLSTPSEREVTTERVFSAPRARVVAAFTEPELIARWWGLRSTRTIVDQLDLRPGGAWRFVELGEDGSKHGFRGIYREVSLPDRLVYSFEWEGMPGHVVIDTVSFEDLGDQTRVSVHSLFHTPQERDWMLDSGMERGLNESYESLDGLLAEGEVRR